MIIDSSSISMISRHSLLIEEEKTESFRAWVDDEDADFDAMEAAMREGVSMLEGMREFAPKVDRNELINELGLSFDSVSISAKAEKFLSQMKNMNAKKELIEKMFKDPVKPGDELYVLKTLIEHLTGEKVKVYDPTKKHGDKDKDDLDMIENIEVPLSEHATGEAPLGPTDQAGPAGPDGQVPQIGPDGEPIPERVGWGIEYQSREFYREVEQTSFASRGVVKTADGREIGFTLNLEMSREFLSVREETMLAGDVLLVDPLVINFAGRAADLTDQKFLFDLDSDGDTESISFVTPGSGILAFDKNSDGYINNGSELFGPSTGNGFMELSAFDEDGNGWIDAADSVYSKLVVWTKDYEGSDTLYSLKDTGVGAIYLESAETLFSINDSSNVVKGQIASTGIYLSESDLTGDITPGTIQQVNLVV